MKSEKEKSNVTITENNAEEEKRKNIENNKEENKEESENGFREYKM